MEELNRRPVCSSDKSSLVRMTHRPPCLPFPPWDVRYRGARHPPLRCDMTRPLGWFAAAIIMLGSPPSISAQAPVDSARLERVMALGKLWGVIGLFHPYLTYRSIDWDSALVVALPLAERAT